MADTNTSPEQRRNSDGKKPRASKVRYAVGGLGYIAQIGVLPAFRRARDGISGSRDTTTTSGRKD